MKSGEKKNFFEHRILDCLTTEQIDAMFRDEVIRSIYFPKFGDESISGKWSVLSICENVEMPFNGFVEMGYFFIDRIKKGFSIIKNEELNHVQNQQLEVCLRVSYSELKKNYGNYLDSLIGKWVECLQVCFREEEKLLKEREATLQEYLYWSKSYSSMLEANLLISSTMKDMEMMEWLPTEVHVTKRWKEKYYKF